MASRISNLANQIWRFHCPTQTQTIFHLWVPERISCQSCRSPCASFWRSPPSRFLSCNQGGFGGQFWPGSTVLSIQHWHELYPCDGEERPPQPLGWVAICGHTINFAFHHHKSWGCRGGGEVMSFSFVNCCQHVLKRNLQGLVSMSSRLFAIQVGHQKLQQHFSCVKNWFHAFPSIAELHLILPFKVKIAVSHHVLASDRSQVSSEKPLVFVLDNLKQEEETGEEGKKKRKKSKQVQAKNKTASTANSFGSALKISQFKGNPKFIIGFRARLGVTNSKFYTDTEYFFNFSILCRLDATSEGGVKTISPIRPVACLAGQLEVGQSVTRLMWTIAWHILAIFILWCHSVQACPHYLWNLWIFF